MSESSSHKFLKYSYGHPFGKAGYLLTGILLFVSFAFFANGEEYMPFVGLAVLLIGIFVATMSHGLIIDTDNKKYCIYGPLKKNQWKDLTPFTDLCLLSRRYSRTLSYKGAINANQSDIHKEVYLMDQHHLKRLYIETIGENMDQNKRLEELSKQLGAAVKTFNPIARREP